MKTLLATAAVLAALTPLPANAGCLGITCVFSIPKEMVGTWCPTKAADIYARGGRCDIDTAIIISNNMLEHGSGDSTCTLGRAAYDGKYRSGTVVGAKFGCTNDGSDPRHVVATFQIKNGRLHLHFED
jgi:hypothetical protein